MTTILITGGAGFIGSNFINLLFEDNAWKSTKIINYDILTYAGNPNNILKKNSNNYLFIQGDICDLKTLNKVFENKIDYVVNFAAETHVDRSITNPSIFVKTNILGTQILLDTCLKYKVKKFIQVSTDEVYGPSENNKIANENSPLNPTSPYAASKAAADLLCLAYFKTFSFPVTITRSCNNYGEYQYPEKLIPFFISKLVKNCPVTLYGDGQNIRTWLYVKDNCRAILDVLEKGEYGEIYNICGKTELTNFQLTELIIKELGKSNDLISFVSDRAAHDYKYSMTCDKIKKNMLWNEKFSFVSKLKHTINWYLEHLDWIKYMESKQW